VEPDGEDAEADGVAVPLGGPEVVPTVSEGLLGAPVAAVLEAAGDDPVEDGLDVAVLAGDCAVGTGMVLGASGCRVCSICCSYRFSCASISARLYELMCRPKALTSFHRAVSCATVEPWGAADNEMSSWIAIAAVRQLMQL
jgi:hypothetical protein